MRRGILVTVGVGRNGMIGVFVAFSETVGESEYPLAYLFLKSILN